MEERRDNMDNNELTEDESSSEESESEEELIEGGIRVDIKRVKSAYRSKTHNETNLPNVLAEYGMSDNKEKERKVII